MSVPCRNVEGCSQAQDKAGQAGPEGDAAPHQQQPKRPKRLDTAEIPIGNDELSGVSGDRQILLKAARRLGRDGWAPSNVPAIRAAMKEEEAKADARNNAMYEELADLGFDQVRLYAFSDKCNPYFF